MFPLLLFVLLLTLASRSQLQAHGTEFISARLDLMPEENLIQLRLGIDYLGNPLIADEAAARAALEHALIVQHGSHSTPYTQLAPLSVQTSSTWEDTLPDSLQPPDDGQPHQILIATWRWRTEASPISFSVLKGNRNDVLLWQPSPTEDLRSTLLLSGDTSPLISIPNAEKQASRLLIFILPTLLPLLFFVLRQRPKPPSTLSED